jgi:hypothetical protein
VTDTFVVKSVGLLMYASSVAHRWRVANVRRVTFYFYAKKNLFHPGVLRKFGEARNIFSNILAGNCIYRYLFMSILLLFKERYAFLKNNYFKYLFHYECLIFPQSVNGDFVHSFMKVYFK